MILIASVWYVIAAREMADFRAGAGKTQDEPGIYCHPGNMQMLKKMTWPITVTQSQNGQIRDSLSIKIMKMVMNHNYF